MEGLFLKPHQACLRRKLLVYFSMCVCRCRWYRFFIRGWGLMSFFTPWHLFCDKSAWNKEEGHFHWASMIRDTTTIDINLPILPHRGKKTGIYRSQCLESQRKGHENIRRENNGQQGCTSWTSGIKKTLLTNIQMFGIQMLCSTRPYLLIKNTIKTVILWNFITNKK